MNSGTAEQEQNGVTMPSPGLDAARDRTHQIHAYLLESVTPKALFTANVDDEDGKAILSIEVPEGKDRPYVFAGSVFVREGSQTRTADAAKLREMVQSKSVAAERWERRPSMAMEEGDLDHDDVRRTVKQAKESGRFAFDDDADDTEVLKALAVNSAKPRLEEEPPLAADQSGHRPCLLLAWPDGAHRARRAIDHQCLP